MCLQLLAGDARTALQCIRSCSKPYLVATASLRGTARSDLIGYTYICKLNQYVYVESDTGRQTSDMRIAVRLWIRGLRNPSSW